MAWFKRNKKKEILKPEEVTPEAGNGFFGNGSFFVRSKEQMHALKAVMERSFPVSMEDYVLQTPEGAPIKDATGAIATMDSACTSLSNPKSMANGLQFMPAGQIAWYASQGFIGYQVCAMLMQHWLIDKACSMPAKDAVRNGYDVQVSDGTEVRPEVLDAIRKADKRMKIPTQCVEYLRFGFGFGIRIALYKVDSDDPKYYEKPFNPDGVTPGSYRGITQIDPYWITPELDAQAAADPTSEHFYEPTWWRVNGKRYHRTHLSIMRNDEVPDILKPTYLYGGVSIPQKIAERVYGAERTANEAPLLAMTKRLTVMNLDVDKALTNMEQFECKMSTWVSLMNNFGVKVIGGDETIEQFDTTLTDLDSVIMTQFQLVAAGANCPATKLLGTTPKGFNSTGEYEEASYHERLESDQEIYLTPFVEGHHIRLIRSYIAPKFGMKPFSTEVNWRPVDSPTALEIADINVKNAQADKLLSDAGAIDGIDIRGRLINDRDSGYNGIAEIVEGQPDMPDDDQITVEDATEFDPIMGTYAGAHLITTQSFLDPAIVEQKRADADYVVDISEPYTSGDMVFRTIIDGHHSLAAAVMDKIIPTFREHPLSSVRNAITG